MEKPAVDLIYGVGRMFGRRIRITYLGNSVECGLDEAAYVARQIQRACDFARATDSETLRKPEEEVQP